MFCCGPCGWGATKHLSSLRLDGQGYGSTLGEFIVSEGLAGQFSLELFGGEPELWERLKSELINSHSPQLFQNWYNTDTIIMLGFSEPGTCQDGWDIPQVSN